MFTKQKVNIIRSKVWSIKELALKKSSLCVWELDSPRQLSPTLWGQDLKDGIPLPGDIPGIQKHLGHLFSCSQLLQNWLLMPPFLQIAELLYSDLICEILVWPKSLSCFSGTVPLFFFSSPNWIQFLQVPVMFLQTMEPFKVSTRFKSLDKKELRVHF